MCIRDRHGPFAAGAVAVAQQQVAGFQRLFHPVDEDGRGLAQRLQRVAGPDHDIARRARLQFAELAVAAEDTRRVNRDRLDRRREGPAMRNGGRVEGAGFENVGACLLYTSRCV